MTKTKSNIVSISKNIQGGTPCIKGTRIPVKSLVYLNKKLKISPLEIAKVYYPQLNVQLIKKAIEWWKIFSLRLTK